ncbi:hypothetical protein Z043_109836, partial [Scleropages formosus]
MSFTTFTPLTAHLFYRPDGASLSGYEEEENRRVEPPQGAAACDGGEGVVPRQRSAANARERDRTLSVNAAFSALRTLIPTEPVHLLREQPQEEEEEEEKSDVLQVKGSSSEKNMSPQWEFSSKAVGVLVPMFTSNRGVESGAAAQGKSSEKYVLRLGKFI